MTSKRKPSILDKYTAPSQLRHALASADLPGGSAPASDVAPQSSNTLLPHSIPEQLTQPAPAAAPRHLPGFVFDPTTNRYFRVSEAKKLRPPPAVQARLAAAAVSERAATTLAAAGHVSVRQPRPNLLAQHAARSVGGAKYICPSSMWRRLVALPDAVPLNADQGTLYICV